MSNFLHTPPVPFSLYVSGVSVDFSKLRRNSEITEVRVGNLHASIEREAEKTLRQTFSPPMEISLGDLFCLHLRHKSLFGMKIEHEDIYLDTEDIFRVSGARGEPDRQEYIKFHKQIKIVIELFKSTTTKRADQPVLSSGKNLELQSTTDEIIRICPRRVRMIIRRHYLTDTKGAHSFRILVIGKTGVGKSSLINQAFRVEVLASHDRPGQANIDTEFISEQNNRFVLHDSKGFEPGEEDNVKIVQEFIQHRRSEPALKDQLHAVWLCFEIPRAGGRFLETGTEAFLALKREGKLGNIPVVVVLTKYDMLLDRVERTLDNSAFKRLSKDAFKKLVKKKADAELKDICIRPLQKFAGRHIPHVAISTKGRHKETLAPLIQMTENLVRQHLVPEASVMTSIAQRVDPGLKLNASIEVGKRRYWKVLASSAAFKNRVIQDCLNVLHIDIVAVWNFHDPHRYLHSKEFRILIANMVDKLDDEPTGPAQTIAIGLPMVGTIAGIVSTLAGPAAPIVVPIAASILLALWVRDVYKTSHTVLRHFMCYIVDLTLVLQTLYLVSGSHELSRRAIKLAVASYIASPVSGEVHIKIQEYNKGLSFLERADRNTLDKIIELMQFYSIGAERISEFREQIPAVDLFSDEPWEVENV